MKFNKQNAMYLASFPLFVIANLVLYNVFRLILSLNISSGFIGAYCKRGALGESYVIMIYWLIAVKLVLYLLFTLFSKKSKSGILDSLVFSFFVFEITNVILTILMKLNLTGRNLLKYFFSNRSVNVLELSNTFVFYVYSAIIFALFVFYISRNIQKFKPKHYVLTLASFAMIVLIHIVLMLNNLGCWQGIGRAIGF